MSEMDMSLLADGNTGHWSQGMHVQVNLAAAAILFAIAVGGGATPKWLMSRHKPGTPGERSLAFSLGNMLSAGVMVSAGFVHLLGDAIEDMGPTDFPVAPLLCATGLLLTIIADSVASSLASDSVAPVGGCCGSGAGTANADTEMAALRPSPSLPRDSDGKPSAAGHGPVSFITAALLGCALALHSFLEGAALGAQESPERTLDVFVAIAAHKGLAAYALGSSLVESKAPSSKIWSVLMFFAVATPVGIVAGLLLEEFATGTAPAACSALASGTFLYVALMEVIPNELRHKENQAMKISTMVLGFSLMSLLAKWA